MKFLNLYLIVVIIILQYFPFNIEAKEINIQMY